MTCTLGPSFGCMHIVPGTGIILNNEGVFFDLDPLDGPNYPAAGKRVQHDMSPTLIFRGERLFLALGTPGGLGITQTIPQVISKVIDHGLPLQAAIESDRYRYFGEGRVRVGDNITAAIRDRLRDAGHEVLPAGRLADLGRRFPRGRDRSRLRGLDRRRGPFAAAAWRWRTRFPPASGSARRAVGRRRG